MKTPLFWNKNNLVSYLLIPFSWVWYFLAVLNKNITKSYFIDIPIIRIGNVVAGGAGKTPLAISIAKRLISFKLKVHFVTKGYKGSKKTTTLVNQSLHNFSEVGEEALLLSNIAPTWIGNKRSSCINAAKKNGAEIIILDDGLQDSSIKGDLNILVFNGSQGIGNKRLIPAGPLREPLNWSINKSHLAVIIDKDKKNIERILSKELLVLKATTIIKQSIKTTLQNKNLSAFCGLGYPEKFYEFLQSIGCKVVFWNKFPDHYVYSESKINKMIVESKNNNCLLVTTQKDHIKIPLKYKNNIFSFPIDIQFDEYSKIDSMLYSVINKYKKNENIN